MDISGDSFNKFVVSHYFTLPESGIKLIYFLSPTELARLRTPLCSALSTTNWIERNSQQPKASREQNSKESAEAQMSLKHGLFAACVAMFEFHRYLLSCYLLLTPNVALNRARLFALRVEALVSHVLKILREIQQCLEVLFCQTVRQEKLLVEYHHELNLDYF